MAHRVTQTQPNRRFPIVCIGGSAGSLDAYVRLLQHLPNNLGAAIVFVSHVRHFRSMLKDILTTKTAIPVTKIIAGMLIVPDRIFLIPNDR